LRKERRKTRRDKQRTKKYEARLEESGMLDIHLRYQGNLFITGKFSESGNYQGKGLWTGFHRWVRTVTGIKSNNQRFAQWDDWDSVTLRRCIGPRSKDFRRLLGKTFKLEEPKTKRRKVQRWRRKDAGPNIVPINEKQFRMAR
jgi:hypothetical protein